MHSLNHTTEKAIAGVVSGLIGEGENVTWRAKHFGIWFSLTSIITQFERPRHFRDSMKSGPFKRFDHDHIFEHENGVTKMRDVFDYTNPFGFLGELVDALFLQRYMTALLKTRNEQIKLVAETNPGQFLG